MQTLDTGMDLAHVVRDDPRNVYALRANGDTFRALLISDGDIVILRRLAEFAGEGLYALVLDDQTVLRHLTVAEDDGYYHLMVGPENDLVVVATLRRDTLEIQGKLIAVIRHF